MQTHRLSCKCANCAYIRSHATHPNVNSESGKTTIKPRADPWCPVKGSVAILEEATPFQIDMLHQSIKVITGNSSVLILSNSPL